MAARHQAGAAVPGRMWASRAPCIERCTAMSGCQKQRYSSSAAALGALKAIQRRSLKRHRKAPTGAYLCPLCRGQWHLTSKSPTHSAVAEETTSANCLLVGRSGTQGVSRDIAHDQRGAVTSPSKRPVAASERTSRIMSRKGRGGLALMLIGAVIRLAVDRRRHRRSLGLARRRRRSPPQVRREFGEHAQTQVGEVVFWRVWVLLCVHASPRPELRQAAGSPLSAINDLMPSTSIGPSDGSVGGRRRHLRNTCYLRLVSGAGGTAPLVLEVSLRGPLEDTGNLRLAG